MSDKGWIAVDLDGTLAQYDGWKGVEHIGDPVPVMLGRVRSWLADGKEVRIFTARVSGPEADAEKARLIIVAWLGRWGLPPLQVTNVKDFSMIELWDDRCRQVIPNTGIPVSG